MSDQEPKITETPPAAGDRPPERPPERPRMPEGDRGGRYRPRDRQDGEGEAEGGRMPGRDRF
jgi:hypothetical protein